MNTPLQTVDKSFDYSKDDDLDSKKLLVDILTTKKSLVKFRFYSS